MLVVSRQLVEGGTNAIFFHVSDGSSMFKDETGQNLSSLDAAMTSAV
jgi:hypothetical protein